MTLNKESHFGKVGVAQSCLFDASISVRFGSKMDISNNKDKYFEKDDSLVE